MKKLIILSTLFLLMLNFHVSADGITVNTPKAGGKIYKGSNGFVISWSVSGNITQKVKIRVYTKAGNKVQSLTDQVDITPGKFFWEQILIDKLGIGEYFVRVKTINNSHYGDSGIFKITNKLNFPITKPKISAKDVSTIVSNIVIEEPVSGSIHIVGSPITIRWNNDFGNYEFIDIFIYKIGGNPITGTCVKNTGLFYWTPESLYNNKPLYIIIKTEDKKFLGKTGNFTLTLPASEIK